ncbi:hypothetical protein Rsub_02696 [Raphidocelis subcapitata]|uniref:Uncharacterized protein n=1 Tax=Raphidocelis subcapitata TaxID=307507 RepID=A0A2V0NWP3_9CHLO|nr:hypothetical protein Rsub_02696 [Raphidocelis subcapitata]|eukprot:GBF89990.1 hypothetical protein Rsub_02696 [Raphidocelis subcapitata]
MHLIKPPRRQKRRPEEQIRELNAEVSALTARVRANARRNARARLEIGVLSSLALARDALRALARASASPPAARDARAASDAVAALEAALRKLAEAVHGDGGSEIEPRIKAPSFLSSIFTVRAQPMDGLTDLATWWHQRMRAAAAALRSPPGAAGADARVALILHASAATLLGHWLSRPWSHWLVAANLETRRAEVAGDATVDAWELALLILRRRFESDTAALRRRLRRLAAAAAGAAAAAAGSPAGRVPCGPRAAAKALDDLAAANAWMPLLEASAALLLHAALLTPRQMLGLYVNAAPAWVPGVTALLDAVERRAAAGAAARSAATAASTALPAAPAAAAPCSAAPSAAHSTFCLSPRLSARLARSGGGRAGPSNGGGGDAFA